MGTILEETKGIMKQYHIKANKALGQNFLISEEVVEKIISCGQIQEEDLIIEVGPGLGTLTKYLLEKAGKVICIELDKKMVHLLKERFLFNKNVKILHQDILTIDLRKLIEEEKQKTGLKHVKIVANLPYYITTPIMMKLLEEELPIESITVMIQKEVADRLIAIPGEKETGAITYSVYYYAEAQGVMEVPHSAFIPEPEVTSKIITLNIRREPVIKSEEKEFMFQIIKHAFMQRRKTLVNALVNTKILENKEEGINMLKDLGIDVKIRPEKLSLEDYARIAKYLC